MKKSKVKKRKMKENEKGKRERTVKHRGEHRGHSIFGIIGLSFQKMFKGNNALIMLPFVFNFIATFIIIGIAILMTGLSLGFMFGTAELDISTLLTLLTPAFILTVAIGLLASWLVSCYFSSGAIGMALDISRKKKINLRVMHQNGRRFFFRYWLAGLIIGLAAVIWLAIFSLPVILTQEPAYLAISILSIIPAIFVFIFFTFAYTLLIVRDLGAWEAVRKSVVFVKKNYWPTFGLVILYTLMTMAVSLIPAIGGIANLIIISPVMTIVFVIFVLERSGKLIKS